MGIRPEDTELLARYVAAFSELDDLSDYQVAEALRIGTDEYGRYRWRPLHLPTAPSALEALYRGLSLPGQGATRLPPLYERLVLSYRWAEMDLGTYRLLANGPAEDLSPLLANLRADESLRSTLQPNGYVQFGKGTETDYDPVCFDYRHRQDNGDCRVVKLDHEAILCHGRIRETAELAPNFRCLVLDTIQRATRA